jgi:hypothetical protein
MMMDERTEALIWRHRVLPLEARQACIRAGEVLAKARDAIRIVRLLKFDGKRRKSLSRQHG